MVDNGYQGETRQWEIDQANEQAHESLAYSRKENERLRRENADLRRQLAAKDGKTVMPNGSTTRLPFDPKEK